MIYTHTHTHTKPNSRLHAFQTLIVKHRWFKQQKSFHIASSLAQVHFPFLNPSNTTVEKKIKLTHRNKFYKLESTKV